MVILPEHWSTLSEHRGLRRVTRIGRGDVSRLTLIILARIAERGRRQAAPLALGDVVKRYRAAEAISAIRRL